MKTLKTMLIAGVLAITPTLTYADFSLDYGATGSLDVNVEDLDQLDELGSTTMIRDLEFRADAGITEWLKARVILACHDKAVENADDCVDSAKEVLKDFSIGVAIPEFGGQKMVVIAGKTQLPFGGNTTQRAVVTNDPLNQTNRELARKKVIMLQWAPTIPGKSEEAKIMNELISLVEFAAYSHDSSDLDAFKETSDYDNYAARISGGLNKVFYKASILDEKNGETRKSLALGVNLARGIQAYGEHQTFKNNAANPSLKSATTLGVSKPMLGGTASAEYSKVKSSSPADDRVAVSYSRPVGSHFSVGAEVDAEKDGDDVTGYLTVSGKVGAQKRNDSRSLFPQIKSRVDARNSAMSK